MVQNNIKRIIEEMFHPNNLWDGSAMNAYINVEILGVTPDEFKETLTTLALSNESINQIISNNELYIHESILDNDSNILMAYWKGDISIGYILSEAFVDKLVICEDNGWYGTDYCAVSINGREAVPGKDYDGDMEYCVNPDFEDEEEDEQYYEISLIITDKDGNQAGAGGGMIAADDVEGYKTWANRIKEVNEINWDRSSLLLKNCYEENSQDVIEQGR